MKRFFLALALLVLAGLGAGCQPMPETPSTIPSSTLPGAPTSTGLDNASSTLPFVRHEDWNITILGDVRLYHPGTSTPATPGSDEATRGLIVTVDLGTAVENPGTRSVPRRTMQIWRLSRNDAALEPCTDAQVGKQGIRAVRMVQNRARQSFCLRSAADAGAGNRFDTQTYTLQTANGGFSFVFTTRSVECQNFPRPEEQCLPFEEARDTALFGEIMGTLLVTTGEF